MKIAQIVGTENVEVIHNVIREIEIDLAGFGGGIYEIDFIRKVEITDDDGEVVDFDTVRGTVQAEFKFGKFAGFVGGEEVITF